MRRAVGALSALFLFCSGAASLAATDAFSAACEARGTAPASCACQAKLARASLDKNEIGAAVAGMRRDEAGFRKAVAAMGENKAARFKAKLGTLGQKARETCP